MNTGIHDDGTLVIPYGINTIYQQQYAYNQSIRHVKCSDTLTTIYSNAFKYDVSLEDVDLGKNLTYLDYCAFDNCISLKNIHLPETLKWFGKSIFYGCKGLQTKQANFKAFSLHGGRMICRDMEYYMGKTNSVRGPICMCHNGLHYCTNLFDIFNYYYGQYDYTFTICLCRVGDIIMDDPIHEDSKHVTNFLTPYYRLSSAEVISILNGGDIPAYE